MLITESAKLAVHSIVTFRTDDCKNLPVVINKSLLKRLKNIQPTAARSVTRKREFYFIKNDLIVLHWLPTKKRIVFKILVLLFKSLHQKSPSYIAEMLSERQNSRRLCSTTSSVPSLIEKRSHHFTLPERSFPC
ncbi:hypothetical protein HOLleu_00421 [Holothuria leucospilota]|uniref:Uncharacterized protein n=1 Tax=Holothuria leucospilota TaxID=206669 RepID=A0A9Q1CNL3_HOLLE|nr:hypothetical protein HOLleu_00421 [Holothuria leucospilota]